MLKPRDLCCSKYCSMAKSFSQFRLALHEPLIPLVYLQIETVIDHVMLYDCLLIIIIIESVDSISRDGPDTPTYIIHYKKRNNSEQENFKRF